jgi:hypothetical protein
VLYRKLFGELPPWRLVLGVVVFGAAMVLRERAANEWLRALIAGAACAWLLWSVMWPVRREARERRT